MRTVIRTITITITLLVLASCSTPSFTVNQTDTRFSESKNAVFVSDGNRVSTLSLTKGRHIDSKGFYVDPFVEKDADTGAVVAIGFDFVNRTDVDSTFGDIHNFGTIEKVVFRFPDGAIVSLDAGNAKTQSGTIRYNSLMGSAGYDKWETAVALVSVEDYARIAETPSISVRVTGSKRSMTYEEADIADSFLPNLRQFKIDYID